MPKYKPNIKGKIKQTSGRTKFDSNPDFLKLMKHFKFHNLEELSRGKNPDFL